MRARHFGQFAFKAHRLQLAALVVFKGVAQVARDFNGFGKRAADGDKRVVVERQDFFGAIIHYAHAGRGAPVGDIQYAVIVFHGDNRRAVGIECVALIHHRDGAEVG